MSSVPVRIVVLGDFRSDFEPHAATGAAFRHAGERLGLDVRLEWVATPDIRERLAATLQEAQGFLIAPGSPYRDLAGMLAGIGYARRSGRPVLGNCAGFQHMVLEYAREVLGIADAGSEEYGPVPGTSVITPLTCSVAGRRMPVHLVPGSRVARIYDSDQADERYYCQFGIAPDLVERIDAAGFRVSGRDEGGEPRVLELEGHPFYLATLYVPQVLSTPAGPHPLVVAFVQASAEWRGRPGTD